MPAGNKYHATIDGAVHGDFENDLVYYHEWIKQMTIAFFDTYLLENTTAMSWLKNKNIENITFYVTLEYK